MKDQWGFDVDIAVPMSILLLLDFRRIRQIRFSRPDRLLIANPFQPLGTRRTMQYLTLSSLQTGMFLGLMVLFIAVLAADDVHGAGDLDIAAIDRYYERIEPVLTEHCYGCHGYGLSKAGVSLDGFTEDVEILESTELWARALRQIRAGIMPPDGSGPTPAEIDEISDWVKSSVFRIDPEDPDPGRVTVRRLNRVEYRNTIRDLMGVDYDTENEFPPDDTGHGFDNIGDVLTISPLLLEKYLQAAKEIVDEAVPTSPRDEDRSRARRYTRFFPKPVPRGAVARQDYARKLLRDFGTRAYRRPIPEQTLDRLVMIARSVDENGGAFEEGIAQAMIAVLASPGFLFREEGIEPDEEGRYPLIDDHALASRLSYFFWSSMPDDELFRLAEQGQLRENLDEQVERMLRDRRSEQLIEQFVGQWLQVRDIWSININARSVINGDRGPDPEAQRRYRRYRELRRKPEDRLTKAEQEELRAIRAAYRRSQEEYEKFELDWRLRRAMQEETQQLFEFIVREDRSVLELLDSDYTFLNERLAKHYGIDGVDGRQMRRVDLPADSPRGGILTQGTFLTVTSNPDRTSPVKRGLFVLENILATPPAPPPPDIPSLEEAGRQIESENPSVREIMALHRSEPLCASCHKRMDPLGLALENFNALGMYRERQRGNAIDASGTLVTGESFEGIEQLKRILIQERRRDFYRCLSEKLLTYALGRGLEPSDVHTVDQLVERLESTDGSAKALITGIVESAPFQRRRPSNHPEIASNES